MTSGKREEKTEAARRFAGSRLPGGYLVPPGTSDLPLLSPEEENILTDIVRNGSDPEKNAARDKLLLSNLRLLVSVAGRFHNRGLSGSELINEGGVGLLEAAERFTPGKGARFSSYSVWRIGQAIRRALARQGRIVRIPLHTLEGLYRMRRIEREFKSTHGRNPETAELALLMGCSQGIVRELKRVDSFSMASIDAGCDDRGGSLAENIPDGDDTVPDKVCGDEENRKLLAEAFKLLSRKEKTVIAMRFGLPGGKVCSLEETAAFFGCSREAVRKIQAKAIRKMRQVYDL